MTEHPLAAGHGLHERSWRDFHDARLLVVPIGSTEQHGPHLPLTVDADVAVALAADLAAEPGAVCAPALAYGASGEHQGFPGTISIGTEVLHSVLVEIGRSACLWVPRVVWVNGHGGNIAALQSAARLLRAEGRDVGWLSSAAPGVQTDAHAGRAETALMRRLRPHTVRDDRLEAGETRDLAEVLPELRAHGVRAVSPNGVLGDPHGATADEGERLLAAMREDARARVRLWLPDASGRLRREADR